MKITRVFLNSDLRCSFDGLRAIAKRARTKPDSNIIFINTSRTGFKLLSGDKYLVYYKNGQRRIPIEALRHLPEHFGGSQFEMDSAISHCVKTALAKRGVVVE